MDMDEDDELVFTQDHVMNLDDFGELEDYTRLVEDAFVMIQRNQIDPQVFARIQSAEVDYLMNENRAVSLIEALLTRLQLYADYKLLISSLMFHLVQEYMLVDNIPEKLALSFLSFLGDSFDISLKKGSAQQLTVLMKMTLYFLKRVSNRFVYIEEEPKINIFLKFFKVVAISLDWFIIIENNLELSEIFADLVEKILRFRIVRQKLQNQGKQQVGYVSDCIKYLELRLKLYQQPAAIAGAAMIQNKVYARLVQEYKKQR